MDFTIEELIRGQHTGLDSFSPAVRIEAYQNFCKRMKEGEITPEKAPGRHNMHCHTFFSYNAFGWSPEHLLAVAQVLGFEYVGKVDFDVLRGINEFNSLAHLAGLPHSCGMETRVFIPEYAEYEINSPGEPGIAYHMGIGFKDESVPVEWRPFAESLSEGACKRTRTVVERVNPFVGEAALDFETDVLPLVPAGNPTERHVCCAYRMKADKVFGSAENALQFWKKVLKLDDAKFEKIAKSLAALEGAIRSALMKRGGPGYITPTPETFPAIDKFNAFVKACGAKPCVAWLNGFSKGEESPENLLDFHISKGAEALTIIPDRNWNIADPVKREASVKNLNAIIAAAQKRGLPVLAGTELNTPGQKLYDDFGAAELAPHLNVFLDGAKRLCEI